MRSSKLLQENLDTKLQPLPGVVFDGFGISLRRCMTNVPPLPTYTLWEDPGHGWLEVTMLDIELLGLNYRISTCSYRKGNRVFLEWDCDMQKFTDAFYDRFGTLPSFEREHHNKDIFIRELPPYRSNRV